VRKKRGATAAPTCEWTEGQQQPQLAAKKAAMLWGVKSSLPPWHCHLFEGTGSGPKSSPM